MTHLPLTLGEHTTANGSPVTITRIGKGGKWAFSSNNSRWNVKTGRHNHMPEASITGRVEPARVAYIDSAALGAWIARDGGRGTMISFATEFHADAVRMVEAAPIEAELAGVTAERDEAVALLRIDPWNIGYADWTGRCRAFLAKIGAKP